MSRQSSWRRELEMMAAVVGAVVEVTDGKHLRVRHPTAGWQVFAPSTPGDGYRGRQNTQAQIRRAVRFGNGR